LLIGDDQCFDGGVELTQFDQCGGVEGAHYKALATQPLLAIDQRTGFDVAALPGMDVGEVCIAGIQIRCVLDEFGSQGYRLYGELSLCVAGFGCRSEDYGAEELCSCVAGK